MGAAPDVITDEDDTRASDEPIVVTGSRIRRSPFTSPDPISIIDPEIAQQQGQFDTTELLQSSPIAAGSSQVTSAIANTFVTDGGEGANTISLRGLGAARTLVLLNGRRAGPAGTRGAVSSFDLNVLPQSVIQSVEILKTGASSIYGSDAVAGVVNLITKRDTDGIEIDGFTSVPFDSGGGQYNLSATWGKDFGRGHILVAADYYRRDELKLKDRKYLNCDEAYIFKPETRERADLVDPRTGEFRCEAVLWGHIWLYDYQYDYTDERSNLVAPNGVVIPFLQFNYPGDNLGQYIPGLATANHPFGLQAPAGWFPVGYDRASTQVLNEYHPFVGDSSFSPKTERYTAFISGSYELTDNIEVFGEFLHNRRETYANAYRQFYQFIAFPGEFPFEGSGFGDPFAPGFSGAVLTSPTGIIDWADSATKVDYTRGVLGARGDFGGALKNWSWDTYVQYSNSDGEYYNQRIFNDAINAANLRTESCVGTTLEVRGVPCVDINYTNPYFLRGDWTQQERDFLLGEETGNTKYTQLAAEGSVTGSLFKLPAGDVGVAVGVSYRRDKLNDVPGEITLAENAWRVSSSGITAGKSVTKEAFGEIEIPLIYNTPFIESFTISAAGRVTNVKTTRTLTGESDADKGNWTYKIGANWQVNDFLRFRGSYGTSFRAPAIFEQVLSNQTGFLAQRDVDPCIRWGANFANGTISQQFADNCAAQGVSPTHPGSGEGVTVVTGGGLGVLEAETSTAKTASIILTPNFSFLPDTKISIAVDYFDIKVNGEISQLGANNIVIGCLSSDFFPDDPLCDLYSRIPAGQPNAGNIINVRDSYINVNSQSNRGFDLITNLRHDMGSWGKLNFLSQMTWQTRDTIALFEGTEVSTNGEDGEPRWVGDFNLVWTNQPGDVSFFYGLDVIGATSDEEDYVDANGDLCETSAVYGDYCVDLTAKARFYHSASLTKKFENFEITAGVSNLFNTKPPRVTGATFNFGEATTQGQSVFSSQYDYIGRRFFIHAKVKM